jgi:hypothetical protein
MAWAAGRLQPAPIRPTSARNAVTDSTLPDNTAVNGGGISEFGTVTVTDCTLSGNPSPDHGAANASAGKTRSIIISRKSSRSRSGSRAASAR